MAFNRQSWVRQLPPVTSGRHGEELCDFTMPLSGLRKLNPDKDSPKAVGILKQDPDKEDKYLIYKFNNSQCNGKPGYVFTCSTAMAKLAIDMDQNGPEHPL